jgi:hypothetical protein
MYQLWVEAEHLRDHNSQGDPWCVDYSAHPLLDPRFIQRHTRVGRFFRLMYNRIKDNDAAYREEFGRMMRPIDTMPGSQGTDRIIEYLNEADAYIRDMIDLLPKAARKHVQPNAKITACNDMRTLMSFLFARENARIRYEAQRKLYLAKLLQDIDHSRSIQDGPRHKAYFEKLLREGLWEHAKDTNTVEIGYNLADDGQSIKYNLNPQPDQERWAFRSIFLEREVNGHNMPLDILYYNCRFKRTVTPISYEVVDGSRRVIEHKRWDAMRHNSSGSIVSKMIRKGINNPDDISDILGAMFIVHDEDGVNDLLTLLDATYGNTIGWRNITDTMADAPYSPGLNRYSGHGYKVYKGDLDILHPNPIPDMLPYLFHVEVQIYTMEGFLRTVHGAHDASHLSLKLRQFLHGLVPVVFPREIYGEEWLSL